jgi:predicted small lipoprotein YifL
MTRRGRVAVLAATLLAAVVSGCGQTGPLVLPDSAQPVEPAAGAAPEQAEPEQADDERQDER